jgi:hypothetical protein
MLSDPDREFQERRIVRACTLVAHQAGHLAIEIAYEGICPIGAGAEAAVPKVHEQRVRFVWHPLFRQIPFRLLGLLLGRFQHPIRRAAVGPGRRRG